MRTRRVGRTDIRVTELGFGGASIGNLYRATSDEVARAAVDAAWAVGIRYFDTAPHYGLGLSERRLGEALRRYPRDEYVLSTKVGRLIVPNPTPTGSDLLYGMFDVPDDLSRRLDYSAGGVRRSLEASLARLGLDRVDVVLVHDPDDFLDQTIAEALPALAELREQGVVGAIGVGMNQWEAPLRVVREADIDVVMLAGRWTLLDRTGEALLDACLERGTSVLAAAPYNSGLLARDRPDDTANFDYGRPGESLVARARALAGIATEHGTTLPTAAIQFPLIHPAVSSVVVGMRDAAQVTSTATRSQAYVDPDAWSRLCAADVIRA